MPIRSRLRALSARLFDTPITRGYLLCALALLVIGAAVAYTPSSLSELVKHLVMTLCILGVARIFQSMKWVWATVMVCLCFVLLLDVASCVVRLI